MKALQRKFQQVGVRLTVIFILVALIPVLAVGIYSEIVSSQGLLQQTIDKQTQVVTGLKGRIEATLEGVRGDLLFLAESHAMTYYLISVDAGNAAKQRAKKDLEQKLLKFAATRGELYLQVRYIDQHGQEIVRIDFDGKTHRLRAKSILQNKSDSVFFKGGMSKPSGQIYVSRLNLNRKHGKIEEPHQPVIRYTTPVSYPSDGRAAGVVVTKVLAKKFLGLLGKIRLVSDDGYYLHHPDLEQSWGAPRDLDNGVSFKERRPGEWKRITGGGTGLIFNEEQAFTMIFNRVSVPGSDRVWYLVAEMPNHEIYASVNQFRKIFLAILVASLVVALGLGTWSARTITRPLHKLTDTVRRVAAGDVQVRARITSGGELEELGNAFDHMVEQRIATLTKMAQENEFLNESIIQLLEATSELSRKNLTIKIPVRADMTGAMADAMNLMVAETASVLWQITRIAHDVRNTADIVKARGDKVTQVAAKERQIVELTMRRLDASAQTMAEVAKLAQTCNTVANRASQSTEKALETVTRTVHGMSEIRETISETEKRIKRLGERSQEIAGVVDIINNIAERTHVLSLNASMQAAAAGESGRGFAVVADEVQRLAESSRNSTSQIAALVRNIQTETSETMATMNRTIDQVIAGSELAEQAGQQMHTTQQNTAELVSAVEQIAKQFSQQAQASNKLREDAVMIHKSTQKTSLELREQTTQTNNLVLFSKNLLKSVEVFKLPQETARTA